MKRYDHLKRKAIEFRHQNMSLGDICQHLQLSKGTVYHWIKDIPANITPKQTEAQKKGSRACKVKYQKLRDEAYNLGLVEYPQLLQEPTFRDFVLVYMTEGYRRCRNQVSVANSNGQMMALVHYWFNRLCPNYKPEFMIQYHEDQSLSDLTTYWGNLLDMDPKQIRVQRKSNSGQLKGRKWRSLYGVLTIRCNNTYFRSRIQAWMDKIEAEWNTLGE